MSKNRGRGTDLLPNALRSGSNTAATVVPFVYEGVGFVEPRVTALTPLMDFSTQSTASSAQKAIPFNVGTDSNEGPSHMDATESNFAFRLPGESNFLKRSGIAAPVAVSATALDAIGDNKVVECHSAAVEEGFALPGGLLVSQSLRSSDGVGNSDGRQLFMSCRPQSSSATFADPASQATHSLATPATRDAFVAPDAVYKVIEDADFFADVLFVWMGVEQSSYATYNPARQIYELNNACGSPRQRSIFAVLRDTGALARQIDLILQRNFSATSFLQQSLRCAVRRQLTQYHYLIATYREKSASVVLTLGDLMVAQKRLYPKLFAMYQLLHTTEAGKGGELASTLQQIMQQGSRRLHSLLSDIYIEAISPLLHMVVSCITKGEVADPFGEFFLTVNNDIDDEADNFWAAKYALSPAMLPSGVSLEVAEEVLLVMKNVRFVRCCCRATQWRMDPTIVAEASHATFGNLASVVRSALTYTNSAVLHVIRNEFHLEDVLRIINAFLLVSYGDFYDLLVRRLEPVLCKLSQTIQVSFVRDQVTSVLLEVTPYARHLDTDRFALLQCELIKDEAKLGWDAFVLTLPMSSPLNNLFDLTAMKVYRRLFRTLFKVKVAEVTLKTAWRKSVALDRIIGGLSRSNHDTTAWREVAADAHLLGLQLNHFVINLWSYLVSEVSTVAWDLLMRSLSRCESFDDMRVAHNAYLAYLTQRCLLHNDCASIRMNIENVLIIVREYCASQALLFSLLERGSGDVASIKGQYQMLTDDFHREMSSLLSSLEEQHLHFDFLSFLLLRLNFNYHYHDTNTSENTEF